MLNDHATFFQRTECDNHPSCRDARVTDLPEEVFEGVVALRGHLELVQQAERVFHAALGPEQLRRQLRVQDAQLLTEGGNKQSVNRSTDEDFFTLNLAIG